jgi:chaperone LolA
MRRLVLAAGFFSVTAFVIVASVHSAAASSSDELARQVEEKYRSLSSLSMDFVKITRSEIFETESKIEGKMLVKNPDKFKIDTEDEIIVCDGEFVWSYSVENQQVIKNLADRSEKVFEPNQYLADFRSGYVPRLTGEEKIDRTGCFVLSLSARDEEVFIKKMTIWVDKKKLLAKKLEYTDSNDNQVTLIFQRIKTNPKIKDSEFIFQTPTGVEELDLSE